MQRSIAFGSRLETRRTAGFRLPPFTAAAYLGLLLALEVLAELWLGGQPPLSRAATRWALLVLAIAPVFGFMAQRSCRADAELAAAAKRDHVRRLTLSLAAERDPSRVPALLVAQLRELSGARLAYLARPLDEGYRIDLVIGDPTSHLVGQALPIGPTAPGLAGEALRTGKPAILSDTWCDAGLAARRELALSNKVRSTAAVPLVARGVMLGLVVLHAEAVDALHPSQTELLQLYAEQAAGPFENALLASSVSQMDEVKQLDQLKTEFLSAVAHELRAPLNPMLGWSELLLVREFSPAEARPLLEQIHEGAQHLTVLVGDLLDLSRGEAGRLALSLEAVDLEELLESAIARWREQAPRHHFVPALAGPLLVQADRHRLRQVLDNLLSNAVKYSPDGSRVFVAARSDADGQVVVRVSDQGLGLTPDERRNLFRKFYRTEAARQLATGTGLGLALCRHIVEAHGGDIQVESEGPGRGTAFTFRLPPPFRVQLRAPSSAFRVERSPEL